MTHMVWHLSPVSVDTSLATLQLSSLDSHDQSLIAHVCRHVAFDTSLRPGSSDLDSLSVLFFAPVSRHVAHFLPTAGGRMLMPSRSAPRVTSDTSAATSSAGLSRMDRSVPELGAMLTDIHSPLAGLEGTKLALDPRGHTAGNAEPNTATSCKLGIATPPSQRRRN